VQPANAKPIIENLYIVGCGGVASYLLPVLLKTFAVEQLVLQDGDVLEERNLDRQLFGPDQIGLNKAQALANLLVDQDHAKGTILDIVPEFFHDGSTVQPGSLIIGCVDNHAARAAMLTVADMVMCNVIFAANEYTDSSAMYYTPSWRGTQLDPRVRYPEITTDHSDDPLRPASCQGVEQQKNSQLAMANFGAANHAMWLLWYWLVEYSQLSSEVQATFSPVEHRNNFNRTNTIFNGQLLACANGNPN
jgi:hypothetical protein